MTASATILTDLFVLFVAAKLGGALFARFKQPAVIGELVVGLVIGPYALGWVGQARPVLVDLFHGNSADAQEALSLVLDIVADLGVIVLLFYVGLETRLSAAMAVGRRSVVVATLGVVVPFAAGFVLMTLMGDGRVEALFVAAALVATSVGITARVLRDLKVIGSLEARVILGAAVADDILAMLVLAVVNQLAAAEGANAWGIALIGLQAVGFTVFVALVGSRVIRRFHIHFERLPFENGPLVLALGVMLGLATLANAVSLAAIIGAFLAGMVLAEAAERYELQRTITPIYEFLVPFFFVIIGTRVDVSVFVNGQIVGLALLVTTVAIASKMAGATLGAWGMGTRSMAIIGTGMVPRGEVGLIIASLALSAGAIERDLFSVVVFMAIVTSLAAPPVLYVLYRSAMKKV